MNVPAHPTATTVSGSSSSNASAGLSKPPGKVKEATFQSSAGTSESAKDGEGAGNSVAGGRLPTFQLKEGGWTCIDSTAVKTGSSMNNGGGNVQQLLRNCTNSAKSDQKRLMELQEQCRSLGLCSDGAPGVLHQRISTFHKSNELTQKHLQGGGATSKSSNVVIGGSNELNGTASESNISSGGSNELTIGTRIEVYWKDYLLWYVGTIVNIITTVDGGTRYVVRYHADNEIHVEKLDNNAANWRKVEVNKKPPPSVPSQNNFNAIDTEKDGKTDLAGVYKRGNKYEASIELSGYRQRLGYYSTKKEAGVVYDKAAIRSGDSTKSLNYPDMDHDMDNDDDYMYAEDMYIYEEDEGEAAHYSEQERQRKKRKQEQQQQKEKNPYKLRPSIGHGTEQFYTFHNVSILLLLLPLFMTTYFVDNLPIFSIDRYLLFFFRKKICKKITNKKKKGTSTANFVRYNSS